MFSAARRGPVLTERRRDTGILQRIGNSLANPDVSDTLLAVGSGLLMGPNWSQGIGMASQNLLGLSQQQQAREMQQTTQERLAQQAQAQLAMQQAKMEQDAAEAEVRMQQGDRRLDIMDRAEANRQLRAERAPMATPAHSQLGNTYVDAEGQWIREVFDPNSGQSRLMNLSTGQPIQTLPQGASRAEQSGVQYRSKAEVEAQTKAAQAAQDAHGKVAKLEQLREVGTRIAGPEAWNMVGRTLAQWTGSSWMDTDDVTMAKYLVADQVLSEVGRLRGLGHMSDREFAAIANVVANPEKMTPETLNTVIDGLSSGHRRSIELYEGWRSADPVARERGFLDYAYDYQRRAAQGEGVAPPATPARADPEVQALLDKYAPVSKPGPNYEAMAAEAEGYAGQQKIEALLQKKRALGASGSW